MTLPIFWRRGSFSVSEAAEIAAITEDTLRGWLARNPSNAFAGAKVGSRLFFSAQDVFFYRLVRDLTRFGVAVRTAFEQAEAIADTTDDDLPSEPFLIVHEHGSGHAFLLNSAPDPGYRSALTVPVRCLAEIVIERAQAVYETEGR